MDTEEPPVAPVPRRRRNRTRSRSPNRLLAGRPTYAALDLGTNNCRLLVARPTASGFRVVDAFSRIVRLGEGLSATGRLSDAAMDRTLDALRACTGKMARHPDLRVRAVATEACRRASNCAEFVARVRAECGFPLEIISSAEEAQLALEGCLPLLDRETPNVFVFDIGGGSTELVWRPGRTNGTVPDAHVLSLPIGVVSFAERFGADIYPAERYDEMVAHVVDRLLPFEAAHRIRPAIAAGLVQMIGTSGTVTTLASVHLGLARYSRARVDGCYLSFDEVAAISARLAALDCASRAAIGGIGPERADLVVAGSAILEGICRTWPVGRLRVADRGLREGMLIRMMAEDGHVAGVGA